MESDKRLETLEEELKLMKGEVKQSLASVRDYLLNMELPSSEFSTIIAALGGGDGEQKITMKGSFSDSRGSGLDELPKGEPEEISPEETEEESISEETEEDTSPEGTEEETFGPESNLSPEEEDLLGSGEPSEAESGMPPEDALVSPDDDFDPESELFSEDEDEAGELGEEAESILPESRLPESELPIEEELPMDYERISAELSQSTPKVNLLANLINWVARAKKEIGSEQLATFLEVYGISGHLSPELKETILHLSEIASEQPGDASNSAEIWSQSILSLHGILTGGNAPLHLVKPSWSDNGGETQPSEDEAPEADEDKPQDMPIKLKLVFPNGNGKGKEYCIDLNPSADSNEI